MDAMPSGARAAQERKPVTTPLNIASISQRKPSFAGTGAFAKR
jgi:hypothetical protein